MALCFRERVRAEVLRQPVALLAFRSNLIENSFYMDQDGISGGIVTIVGAGTSKDSIRFAPTIAATGQNAMTRTAPVTLQG